MYDTKTNYTMYQEMRTKDDAWMQSIHESIDQLSEILDSMPKDSAALQHDDEYLCDKEGAYMLKVSRRTLSEYRSNGTFLAMYSVAKSCTSEVRLSRH